MAAVGQGRGRCEGPVARGIGGGGAEQRGAVEDADGAVGFGGAGQRRRGVVGAAASRDGPRDGGDSVGDGGDDRCGRGGGVHRQGECQAGGADIACRVGGRGGQAVAAVGQGGGRCEGPVARGIGGGGAEQRGAIEDADGAVGFGGAGQRRHGVVGAATGRNVARYRCDVIGDGADDRYGRGRSVDRQREGRTGGADVAGRIGSRGGEAVAAVGQCRGRREGPVAQRIGGGGAEQRGAVEDADGAVGLGGAGQCRGGVIGAATGGDRARHRCDVIGDGTDDRCGRGGGVHRQGEYRAGGADVAGRVGDRGGQAVAAVGQGGGRRESPVA